MTNHLLPMGLGVRWLYARSILPVLLLSAGSFTHAAATTLPVPATIFFQDTTQQRIINGRVTDVNQQPLPGVNVSLQGTSTGTATNEGGYYTLRATKSKGILVFSSMGFQKKEIPFSGQAKLDMILEPDQKALGEVVVVGYGTQKKVNLVGSVSVVKMDEKVTNRALPNTSSALSGLAPGLAVTQSSGMAGNNAASLIIRGLGTVNNASPLVVVDGMPDVDINRINMNDIETISILKDATSAAVYGSRAANGVILITTKSGKGQKKTAINFSGGYGVEVPTRSYDFMADYARALTLHQRAAAVNTLREYYNFKDGTIDQWMAMGMVDPLRFPNTDWWEVIMRNGSLQNYNLSASGGTENSNFFISAGIMNEKGLQINNDYKRYNARFNYDNKLRKNMNAGLRFNGNWSKYTYALADGYTDDDASNTAGFDLQYAIAGITPYDPLTGYYGGVMAYNEDPQAYNPYTVYQNMLNRQNRQEANAMAYWDWEPIKGLTGRVDYTLNYYNQFRWNANIPNRSFNFQTGTFGSRVYVGENAGVGNYTNTGYKTMLNGRLTYQHSFGSNHDISLLGVYSEEFWYDRYQGAGRNDRLYPTLHEVDAALTDIQSTGGNSSTEGLRSYIGRANYTAFGRYLLEASFRYDGSSRFLPGHQYGFFPSGALGWRFTEEPFINPFTKRFLSNGKLRVTYGALGNNSGVGRYEQQGTLAASNYMIDGTIVKGFVNQKMVNRDLSWETTKVLNIGLDLGFFDNRLTTELEYYNRLTSGMNRPSEMSILLTGAYSAPRRNIGNLRNQGFELNLLWSDQVGELKYGLNLNASYNTTRLEKWNEFLGRGWVFLDMPYHFLYTYEDVGIAQTWQDVYSHTPQGASPGDIIRKDLNGDGRIDGNDMRAYPNVQRDRPTTMAALNTNFSWKGIDLSFLITGATGRKDFWINNYNNINFGLQRYASSWNHWNNPWSVENRDGEWPRLGGSNNRVETSFWLDNLSYIRFKNIMLSYSFPKKLLDRIGIANFRIYCATENIATITSFRGLDPELTGNRSNAYPLNRSYAVGLNMGL
ncbi:TonB-dependent receptor [Chitinophaga filiformis]|uniref:SusC/RagA family TonB-linked outer membrane protein n=1 Tax=Chitinophaga filiformis TaxID=104663 RepID=UPI001F360A29|nr:TonB-dependent receptor [Chitinophaga filiformis]MCF6405094.1 TonB-dependent receptor [Chitinophaga filiformis]